MAKNIETERWIVIIYLPLASHHEGEKDEHHHQCILLSPTVLMEHKHHIVHQQTKEHQEANQVRPHV